MNDLILLPDGIDLGELMEGIGLGKVMLKKQNNEPVPPPVIGSITVTSTDINAEGNEMVVAFKETKL